MIRSVVGTATHVGQVRQGNEDAFVAIDGLYFVADGMGGHSAGEIASAIAVQTLEHIHTNSDGGISSDQLLESAITSANTAVHAEALLDSAKSGMGTTLTGLAVTNAKTNEIVVGNVGDSRTYIWRHGELRQVTKDHSHVQSLVDRGAITRSEARVHFQRNVVLRAIGIDPTIDVDSFPMVVENNDRFIICSDGLIDEADDAEIETEIRLASNVQDLADRLVDLANRNGGRDNITVLVIDFFVSEETITDVSPESILTETYQVPIWFSVAAYALWLSAAAIALTVIISAITSGQ